MPSFANGQLISAVITSRTEQIAAFKEKSGFVFEAPAAEVKGNVGDSVTFEVLSNHKGLILKQVEQAERDEAHIKKHIVKQAGITEFKDLMEHSEFSEREINFLNVEELTERVLANKETEARALSRLRREANSVADNAARAAVRALVAEGVNVTGISLSSLSEMLTAIGGDANIEIPPSVSSEIIGEITDEALLKELDIPETRRNTEHLEETVRKIQAVKDIDVEGVLRFIKSDSAGANLNELYNYYAILNQVQDRLQQQKHKVPAPNIPEAEILRVFDLEGIEPTAENLKTAELFIEYDIPVNKRNIDKFNFLVNIKDMDERALLAKALLTGDIAADLEAAYLPLADYEEIVHKVSVIKAEHIDLALLKGDVPLTIKDLAAIAESNPNMPAKEYGNEVQKPYSQLAEIALKLTYEAAAGLHAKNIQIDLLTLTEAVDALKEQENQIYAKRLEAVNAPVNPENIGRAAEAVNAARSLRTLPASAIGDIINSRVAFALRELSELSRSVESRVIDPQKTAEMYTAYEARPTARYGDALTNVTEQFAKILENENIPATEANIRAAKIAAANNMDISNENLLEIKGIDAKLQAVASTLSPMIAAQMVKDGYNPLDKTIDDILKYIAAFGGADGENAETRAGQSLAEKIYAMDKSKELSPEEREAMMAIFKALNIAQKYGARAVGAALKAEASFTLGRLLSLSETFNKAVSIGADDNPIPYRKSTGSVLRDILENIAPVEVPVDNAEYYGMKLVNDAARGIDASVLASVLASASASASVSASALQNDNLLNMEVEDLLESLQKSEKELLEQETTKSAEITKTAAELQNIPAALMKKLQDAGVPVTLANVINYRKVSNGRLFSELSSEQSDIDNEAISEALEKSVDDIGLSAVAGKGFGDYIRNIYDALNKSTDADINDAKAANDLMLSMRLLFNTARPELGTSYFPVKFNGGLADVNIHILNDDLENAADFRVVMLLNSKMGETRLDVAVKDGQVFADMKVNGADEGYSEGLLGALPDARRGGALPPALPLNKLPEHIRAFASAALKYAEGLEKTITEQ